MRPIYLALFAGLSFPLLLQGQESRFELGQRLRLFDRALDKTTDVEARRRALEPLEQVTPTFFRGQLGAAAGLLDRSRLLLGSETPSDESLWAESLVSKPGKRLLDTSATGLPVKIESLYKVDAKRPERVQIRLTLLGKDGKAASSIADLGPLPFSTTLALKEIREGDYQLRTEVLVGGAPRATGEQAVALADRLAGRLAKLKTGLEVLDARPPSHEKATLVRLLTILTDLDAGRTPETNYPAARLLSESEAVLAALESGKAFYGPARAGQFWLSLATGTTADPVRVQIPEAAKKGKPLPLVVAMHGAGGSENMFFDGYGDGAIARGCAKRGWLLVTTRTPLISLGGGPDAVRVVDALAKVYPVDTRKVFLVGHSMGAAQAVATAGRRPERFVAVAALGGGGGFKESEAVKDVRFFVGCGERDFALNAARTLHGSLTKAGVKEAVFKAYPDVEHLIVVQVALSEVFRFFEEASGL